MKRRTLQQAFKFFWLILGLACIYVLFDFSFDRRPPAVQSSYRFELAGLPLDSAIILRQDNLSILVIHRSAATIARLRQFDSGLQDAESDSSRQPDFAINPLRSKHEDYFVAYALGTDLGCGLVEKNGQLGEICGQARYDFAGRALDTGKSYPNLLIPEYEFSRNFSHLTINP